MTKQQRGLARYHAFVRSAKKDFELSHKQAIGAYRAWVDKFGKPTSRNSIRDHPRVAKRIANDLRSTDVKQRPGERVSKPTAKRSERDTREQRTSGGAGAGRRINSVSQWDDFYDDLPDYYVEWEVSADYGEE